MALSTARYSIPVEDFLRIQSNPMNGCGWSPDRYTRLDREALFQLKQGGAVDHDAAMLLNQKAAAP